MKRLIGILTLGALLAAMLLGCGAQGGGEAASVESVGMITGMGSVGVVSSFAGKVVSGETAEIKKDADKTVLEVYVAEGDMVKEGDVLFSYDMEAMQLALDKLYLEKESYENTISAAESEIEQLQKEKASASSSQQLSYTLQIDSRNADIREAEYNIALKDREIASMEAAMENTEITTPLSGRVMSVGSADEPGGGDYEMDMGGDSSDAFITVMDVSAYRVEGNINELNRGSLMEGMRVVVRSRIDDNEIWSGVIDSIDWEKPVTGNQQMYYGGNNDEMTSSSKYPFYVMLDSTDGLMLGQHVYIEPDYGQGEETLALMLPAYYISDAESSPWVWAASAKDKLEKRAVTLGAYDADMDEYEIVSGLDVSDYIAFPDESLSAGMDVVYYDESSFGGEDMVFDEGFDMGEDVYSDEDAYAGEEFVFDESFDMGDAEPAAEIAPAPAEAAPAPAVAPMG